MPLLFTPGLVEEGVDKLENLVLGVLTPTDRQDLRIVVGASKASGVLVPAKGATNALYLVGSHLLTVAGTTQHKAERTGILGHSLRRSDAESRVIILRVILVRATIRYLVTGLNEMGLDSLFGLVPCMVSTQINMHTPKCTLLPMPHAPVVRKVRHNIETKPFIVIWEVTRACALVCKHCRADAQHEPHPDQLTTEEGKRLLDQLASYQKPYPLVVFTGGDPFERADLAELCRYGTDLGLSVSLSPSVTPKVTPERLHELREAGGKAMSMSLDGATPATHDAFRGFSGTFDATLEKAPLINAEGYRLQINSTLTKGNIREAPALLKRVIDMQAKMWYVFFLVPTGRGADLNALSPKEREDTLVWLDDISDRIAIKTTEAPQYRRVVIQQKLRREGGLPSYEGGELYRYLTEETERIFGGISYKKRKPRAPMAVNSGSGFAFIDHIGDVYPNGFLPFHCGNVKQQTINEIYAESRVFVSLRHPEGWHGKCAYCDFHDVCGGSRSTAYALTGDVRASDDQCCYVPQAWLDAGGTRVHPEHGTGIQISRNGEIITVPDTY